MSQRGRVGKIWGPYEPSPANFRDPGGVKHPQNGTKITNFWLKIDCLTLKFHKEVNLFSLVSEGDL